MFGVFWGFVKMMLTESFPPSPKWTADGVPNLGGKVILITGGNSGLGLETAKVLVRHDAKVYITSRDEAKGKAALAEIEEHTGRTAYLLKLDLADLDSVKRASEQFSSQETRLDVLYNSGGVMIPPLESVSKDGYDLQFATNCLGHFYLTKLLMPLLLSAVQTKGHARVVNVTSGAHHGSAINYATLRDGPARRRSSPQTLYAQSKYGVVVFAAELARRYGGEGIVSTALNPGNMRTPLQREITGVMKRMVNWMLYPVVPNGIVTHLYAGTATETANCNGKYFRPWARIGEPRKDTQDPAVGRELWTWLEEQVAGRA